MKIDFILNNEEISVEIDPLFSVLRYLREIKGLTSVKTGCGEGECGACTVLLGTLSNSVIKYKNVASCILPIGELEGKHIVTLEGINGDNLTPVQDALVNEGAVQCGFCTPGFVMSLTGFFLSSDKYTDEKVLDSIDGNICRCTGYYSIKRASEKLVTFFKSKVDMNDRIESLITHSLIPEYFGTIVSRLKVINKLKVNEKSVEKSDKENLFIGGGTDLLVGQKEETGRMIPKFVSRADNLSEIFSDEEFIRIGAGVTTEEIKKSKVLESEFPGIPDFMSFVSSTLIRNVATLGGNIVNASPIGDLSILFLSLDAILTVEGEDGEREVELKRFFTGYKKMDLKKGELLKEVRIPKFKGERFLNFEKVSRRKYLDIAGCNSAACFYIEGQIITKCDLSAGGVAPVPLFLKKSSSYLKGKKIEENTLDGVLEIVKSEISPISDVRGSANYKKELLMRLIRAHFNKVFKVIGRARR